MKMAGVDKGIAFSMTSIRLLEARGPKQLHWLHSVNATSVSPIWPCYRIMVYRFQWSDHSGLIQTLSGAGTWGYLGLHQSWSVFPNAVLSFPVSTRPQIALLLALLLCFSNRYLPPLFFFLWIQTLEGHKERAEVQWFCTEMSKVVCLEGGPLNNIVLLTPAKTFAVYGLPNQQYSGGPQEFRSIVQNWNWILSYTLTFELQKEISTGCLSWAITRCEPLA